MHYDEDSTETTLGELVEAVSDSAMELCEDRREAYYLASIVLEKILKSSGRSLPGFEIHDWPDQCGGVKFH